VAVTVEVGDGFFITLGNKLLQTQEIKTLCLPLLSQLVELQEKAHFVYSMSTIITH
jgi:hypothetical protein